MGVNGIYGLSGSGLDIESMVKVGMMSKQNEYDKMAQKFTKNEWMKADYLEINSKITTFNSSTLSQYKMSNTMNAKSAESSSSAVKVSASSAAPLMNHKVEVSALSSNAYLISTGTLTRYDLSKNDVKAEDQTSIQLKDILYSKLETSATTDASGNTITQIDSAVTMRSTKADGTAGSRSTISLESNANGYATGNDIAFRFYLSDGVTKEKDSDGNETDELKKAEIKFTYQEILDGATLNDLASQINSAGLNIKASYDSVNDRFSLYNSKGGAANNINISIEGSNKSDSGAYTYAAQNTENFLDALQLYKSVNGELYSSQAQTDGSGNVVKDANGNIVYKTRAEGGYAFNFAQTYATDMSTTISGSDGIIKVDGMEYKTTDNKATVNGVTYTALNTTASAATVSVSQDTDSIIEKVKSFVTDYNKLLASLYEKYDEKPNSDYKPLTQSQKDQMKDEQIEKWEEKAKKGLLYHDQTLGKVIMNMRNAVSESVDGIDSKYNSIYSLGISTTGLKGQLVLDEDKLKKAMAEDPDAVYNVFAKLESATTDNKNAVYQTDSDGNVTSTSNGNGIAQRLGDIFVEANKLIKERAGSSSDITEDSDLNSLLRNLQTKMSNFKKMMSSFEDALYKKYDAMESTLAKLGTQLNFVMGNTGQ